MLQENLIGLHKSSPWTLAFLLCWPSTLVDSISFTLD